MLKKIRLMEQSQKLKLIVILILFIITVTTALVPIITNHKSITTEELREKLKDTAWERKTNEGKEARLFTQFGDYFIADLDNTGMLTNKSCWLHYEIINKNTINLSKDELPERLEKYLGDHKIYLIDDNTIKINGIKYKKANLKKWLDIGYDLNYWKNIPN